MVDVAATPSRATGTAVDPALPDDDGAAQQLVDEVDELLVEEVSIDGMCGVY